MDDISRKSVHLCAPEVKSDNYCGCPPEKNYCGKCAASSTPRPKKVCHGGGPCMDDCKYPCKADDAECKIDDLGETLSQLAEGTSLRSEEEKDGNAEASTKPTEEECEANKTTAIKPCSATCTADCKLRKMQLLEAQQNQEKKMCPDTCEGICRTNQKYEQQKLICMKSCKGQCKKLDKLMKSGQI